MLQKNIQHKLTTLQIYSRSVFKGLQVMIKNQFPQEKVNGIFTAVALYRAHADVYCESSGILAYSVLPAAVCYLYLCMFNSVCGICQSLKNMIVLPKSMFCLKCLCVQLSDHIISQDDDLKNRTGIERLSRCIALWDTALYTALCCSFREGYTVSI